MPRSLCLSSRSLWKFDEFKVANMEAEDEEDDGYCSAPPLLRSLFVETKALAYQQHRKWNNYHQKRHSLPPKYKDPVRAIMPGLPLFLYNYTTHQLHGVYQAVSFGGSNIDPTAWQDKKCPLGGSRFPAQVRIRTKKKCKPLEEDAFRPFLYHYDGPKFRLQLSVPESQSPFGEVQLITILTLLTAMEVSLSSQFPGLSCFNKSNLRPIRTTGTRLKRQTGHKKHVYDTDTVTSLSRAVTVSIKRLPFHKSQLSVPHSELEQPSSFLTNRIYNILEEKLA
ncbi:hypothetical protein L484_012649 [Morus notabilis]|uniref:DCD domain-containing protein n=1 Tax=Morus notabilis TaxID=981085 RepID=W9SK29_9ROSA|nr:hypothetical protein L484_012649 [Morus notabilis]